VDPKRTRKIWCYLSQGYDILEGKRKITRILERGDGVVAEGILWNSARTEEVEFRQYGETWTGYEEDGLQQKSAGDHYGGRNGGGKKNVVQRRMCRWVALGGQLIGRKWAETEQMTPETWQAHLRRDAY